MNLYFRLVRVLLRAFFVRSFLAPKDVIKTEFRVWPNDLDFNFHMNNGRYLTIMDLGRFEFMSQTGILFPALKRGWFPILGEAQLSFYRPLKLFQKFRIETQLEGFDEKWFIISQTFISKEKLIAKGLIRGLLRGSHGNIAPKEVLGVINASHVAGELSPEVKAWVDLLVRK